MAISTRLYLTLPGADSDGEEFVARAASALGEGFVRQNERSLVRDEGGLSMWLYLNEGDSGDAEFDDCPAVLSVMASTDEERVNAARLAGEALAASGFGVLVEDDIHGISRVA